MEITLNVPEDLATRLRPVENELPRILELGIREWQTHGGQFAGLAGLLETLASLPSPQEVLALRPSADLQERLEVLAGKARADTLSPDEQREWDHYRYVEHLVRMAKARAALKLQGA